MLETLDAKKFCSGHAEVIGREDIKKHIEDMKKRQDKVKSLVEERISLENIKKEFQENEARLVEVIYNEIKEK